MTTDRPASTSEPFDKAKVDELVWMADLVVIASRDRLSWDEFHDRNSAWCSKFAACTEAERQAYLAAIKGRWA